MGYAPWSEGLGIVLRKLHDDLPGRPLLICEHGVGTDDDEFRCDILRESLSIVSDAIDDGIDVRGFFHWTGVDNYEWNHGFDVQFGCFTRDREAPRQRRAPPRLRHGAWRSTGRSASERAASRRGYSVTSSQVTCIIRQPAASSARDPAAVAFPRRAPAMVLESVALECEQDRGHA